MRVVAAVPITRVIILDHKRTLFSGIEGSLNISDDDAAIKNSAEVAQWQTTRPYLTDIHRAFLQNFLVRCDITAKDAHTDLSEFNLTYLLAAVRCILIAQ